MRPHPPRAPLFPYTTLFRSIGLPRNSLVEYWQKAEELAHYARATVDILYKFPPSLARNARVPDRKSTRLNSSHRTISYAVFCLKKKITVPINTLVRRISIEF